VEFVEDTHFRRPFPAELAFGSKVQLAAFDMGIAVYPGVGTVDGSRGDHILIAPPYTVSEGELTFIVSTLKRAYDKTVTDLIDVEHL
jgi:adenosylmethionine-8-amino-7-oxononanoate aminotransferase